MKPYDFYKVKFDFKHPDKDRKYDYRTKDFFDGKDHKNKDLNLSVLNGESAKKPRDYDIFRIQEKILNNVFNEIKQSLGDDYLRLSNLIKSAGEGHKEEIDKYKIIQTIRSDFKKKTDELKKTYSPRESKSQKTKTTFPRALKNIRINDAKAGISDLIDIYNTFITLIDRLLTYKNYSFQWWNEIKQQRDQLVNKFKSLNDGWEQLNAFTGNPNNSLQTENNKLWEIFKELITKDQLDSYFNAIKGASNIISGILGEYVAFTMFQFMINELHQEGEDWLRQVVNTGSLHMKNQQGKSVLLRVDHIFVTKYNRHLPVVLTVKHEGRPEETIQTTLKNLNKQLSNLQEESKKTHSSATIIVKNWDYLEKRLYGYTVQTKFREDEDSILNSSNISQYSITQLINETKNLGGKFTTYANFLDLFVRWYAASAARWKGIVKDNHPSRLYAEYKAEKPSTYVYTRYFNYLLSRTEAIKKIYAPGLFWYMTTQGGFSLEDYYNKKLGQASAVLRRNSMLVSARTPVNLEKPNESVAVNMGHELPKHWYES